MGPGRERTMPAGRMLRPAQKANPKSSPPSDRHRTLPMEMPVNECAICDVGGYQTCAGVGGQSGSGSGSGPADCRRDEQPWPWRLDVAGRGLACGAEQSGTMLDQRNSLKHKRDDNNV